MNRAVKTFQPLSFIGGLSGIFFGDDVGGYDFDEARSIQGFLAILSGNKELLWYKKERWSPSQYVLTLVARQFPTLAVFTPEYMKGIDLSKRYLAATMATRFMDKLEFEYDLDVYTNNEAAYNLKVAARDAESHKEFLARQQKLLEGVVELTTTPLTLIVGQRARLTQRYAKWYQKNFKVSRMFRHIGKLVVVDNPAYASGQIRIQGAQDDIFLYGDDVVCSPHLLDWEK